MVCPSQSGLDTNTRGWPWLQAGRTDLQAFGAPPQQARYHILEPIAQVVRARRKSRGLQSSNLSFEQSDSRFPFTYRVLPTGNLFFGKLLTLTHQLFALPEHCFQFRNSRFQRNDPRFPLQQPLVSLHNVMGEFLCSLR